MDNEVPQNLARLGDEARGMHLCNDLPHSPNLNQT